MIIPKSFFFPPISVEGIKTLLPRLSRGAYRPLQIVSSDLRILAIEEIENSMVILREIIPWPIRRLVII